MSTSPIRFRAENLHRKVETVYDRLATRPEGDFHFHHGPEYACRVLRYYREEIEALPAEVTRSFAGLGNPHRIAPIEAGATVLDVGCGAGTDLLLAAGRVGPRGRAIGVDMTEAMRARAVAGARALGLSDRVEVLDGLAEALPLEDESVDVVISNGVLNLAPDKPRAFREIVRVLRPGGRLQLADIAVAAPLDDRIRGNYELWAA
jgi:SAM-dependent methyltransferase